MNISDIFLSDNTVYSDKSGNAIVLGDALECTRYIKNNTIDLIIADPPYYQIYGDFDFVWKDKEEYLFWVKTWLIEFKRILKNTGTLILWGYIGHKSIMLARIAIMIEDENLFIRQNWITQRNTRGSGIANNYMSAREDLLFLTKSDNFTFNIPYTEEKSLRKDLGYNGKPRKNTHKRVSNVWSDITEASQSSIERCDHPTVKAQKLCDRIILSHSNKNDSVFIPFAGAGSEIISAIKNGRMVLGSEISEKYVNLAINRIFKLSSSQFYLIS